MPVAQKQTVEGKLRPNRQRLKGRDERRAASAPINHAARLIAPGRAFQVPSIAGVKPVFKASLDLDASCRYAAAGVKAGVFDPTLWKGDVAKFLDRALESFLLANGASEAARRFSICIALDSSIGYVGQSSINEPLKRMFLHAYVESIGVVDLQATYDRFENLTRGAGAAFVWRMLNAVNNWWPTWDFRDAAMAVDYRNEMADEEPGEFERVKLVVPEGLDPNPVSRFRRRSAQRLDLNAVAARGNRTDRALASRLEELHRASISLGRKRVYPSQDELDEVRDAYLYDADSPIPVLMARLYDGDQLTAYFDEFCDVANQTEHEPAFLQIISGPDHRALGVAFRHLGAAVRTLAAMARLMDVMPGNKRNTYGED
jgi:hypothetical protein